MILDWTRSRLAATTTTTAAATTTTTAGAATATTATTATTTTKFSSGVWKNYSKIRPFASFLRQLKIFSFEF